MLLTSEGRSTNAIKGSQDPNTKVSAILRYYTDTHALY